MAVGTNFQHSNFVLKGNGDDIYDLHAHRDAANNQFVTCWRLSPAEIAEIAKTGVVWLHVVGTSHPPVMVQGTNPFVTPDAPPVPPEPALVTILAG